MEQHSTSVDNVGGQCYSFQENIQVELYTILIINKILVRNNSMILRCYLISTKLFSDFDFLLHLIDNKFIIHLHNFTSFTISYSEHDIME